MTRLATTPLEARLTALADRDLLLVATLLTGNLFEGLLDENVDPVPDEETFALFVLNASRGKRPAIAEAAAVGGGDVEDIDQEPDGLDANEDQSEATRLQAFRMGLAEAVRRRLLGQQVAESVLDVLASLGRWFDSPPATPALRPSAEVECPPLPAIEDGAEEPSRSIPAEKMDDPGQMDQQDEELALGGREAATHQQMPGRVSGRAKKVADLAVMLLACSLLCATAAPRSSGTREEDA